MAAQAGQLAASGSRPASFPVALRGQTLLPRCLRAFTYQTPFQSPQLRVVPPHIPGTSARKAILAQAAAVAQLAPVTEEVIIPGGKGKAVRMQKGDVIKIVNLHGTQVVDFWAFAEDSWGREVMSMHHTRNALRKLTPQAGDTLYTASMLPIMSFLEDSGPGVHDTTAAACSYGLYVLQIGEEAAKEHDSCTNNLYNALAELGLQLAEDPRTDYYTPAPFNLWMNVTDQPDASGYNWVLPPKEQKAGDYCTFQAEQNVVVALSACPWDLGEMNGAGGKPQDVSFQVFRAAA